MHAKRTLSTPGELQPQIHIMAECFAFCWLWLFITSSQRFANHTVVSCLASLQSRLSVRSLRHACLLASLLLLCLRHVHLLLPDCTQCSAALYVGCSTHPQGLALMKRAGVHFRESHVAGTRSAPSHSCFPVWLAVTAAAAHVGKRAGARARADGLRVHPLRGRPVPRRRRAPGRRTRVSELRGHRGEGRGGPGGTSERRGRAGQCRGTQAACRKS